MWYPTTNSDELYHHGIQGQKWGKKNGPPYPLDRSDYSQAERKYRTDKGYNKNTGEHRKGKKPVSKMSNQELQRKIDRKELEKRYTDLDDQQVSRGRQKVMGIVRDYATVAAAVLTTAKLIETGAKIVKHL